MSLQETAAQVAPAKFGAAKQLALSLLRSLILCVRISSAHARHWSPKSTPCRAPNPTFGWRQGDGSDVARPRARVCAAQLGRCAAGEVGSLLSQPPAAFARPAPATAGPGRAPACPARAGRRLLPPRADQRQHQVLSHSGKYCARSAPRCRYSPKFSSEWSRRQAGPRVAFQMRPCARCWRNRWRPISGRHLRSSPARRIGRVSENFPAPTPALRTLRRRGCVLCSPLSDPPAPGVLCRSDGRAQVMAWHGPGHTRHRQSEAWASPWCSASPREIHPKLDASQAQRYRSVSETAT